MNLRSGGTSPISVLLPIFNPTMVSGYKILTKPINNSERQLMDEETIFPERLENEIIWYEGKSNKKNKCNYYLFRTIEYFNADLNIED